MELGDPTTTQRDRSVLAVALDTLETALTDVIEKVETGGLEQLDPAEKVEVWQRFETFRNRLPLIDHSLIAHAEATNLARKLLLLHYDPVSGAGAATLPHRSRLTGPSRSSGRTQEVDAG